MPIEFKITPDGAEYNGTELTRILANNNLIYYQPYTFTLRKDGTYEVSGVKAGEILAEAPSLPISYRSTTVTAIGKAAFKGRTDIKTITIPDTYTQIGEGAFSGCSNLETLTVPEKCKTFGDGAFASTTIKKVYATSLSQWIGSSFASRDANPLVGGQAELYLGGSLLTALEVPTAATINAYAFVNYKKLAAVSFNNGAGGTIGTGAFQGTGIQSLELKGASFKTGSSGAFANCGSLITVTLPITYSSWTLPDSTFSNCTQLTTVKGGAYMETIGAKAFYGCKALAGIDLSNVKTIEAEAFRNCTALKYIVLPASLEEVKDGAFNNAGLSTVYYKGANNAAWTKITISSVNNSALTGATRLYYSESDPLFNRANYWSYMNGIPTVWKSDCRTEGHKESTTPTCTEGVYCDVCGQLVKAALGHDYEFIAEVPATCTAEGYTAHQHCKRCQHKEGYRVLSALGHSHETIPYQAPNCYAPGHTEYQICHCGDKIGYEVIPQLEHVWEEIRGKEPTCTEPGYTAYKKCKLCGEIRESEERPATGHLESGWIVDKEATCIEMGSQHKECTECGVILERDDISTIACTPGDWIVDREPTCTEEGSRHNKCTCCGKVLTTEVILAKGHKPGEWVTGAEPTCTEPGYKYKACTVCGVKLEEVEIPATGHSYELRVDGDGKPYQYCTVCGHRGDVFIYNLVGDSYSISVVDGAQLSGMITIPAKIGETPVTQIAAGAFKDQTQIESIIIPDSITAIGAEAFSGCTGLFRIFYQGTQEQWDDIEKTEMNLNRRAVVMFYIKETDDRSGKYWGYDESGVPTPYCDHRGSKIITSAVAPTCIKNGTTEGKRCGSCKTVLTPVEVDPATGHTPGDWETTTEQTCTSSGIRRKYCTVCGQMADMEILPAGHTYGDEIPALEVTCTENGHTAYRECTRCGHKDGYAKLMSQGHTWGERVPAEEPTCDEIGWNSYATCTKCGETTGYTVRAPKGHDWSSWVVDKELTEDTAGERHRTCVRCGKTETETIPINPCLRYLEFAEIRSGELAGGYKVRAKAGTTYTGAVEIPAEYNGKPVVAIDTISTYISPTSLTIPDSVVEIMENAFTGCKDLNRLIIPDSVKKIQSGAFAGCENLEQLSLGAGLSYLSYEAFNDCTKLKHVIVGSDIRLTGNTSFKGCPNITFVYYKGTASEWSARKDQYLGAAPITAYYSEKQPEGSGCYWTYNRFSWCDDLAVIWPDLTKFEFSQDLNVGGPLLKLKKGVKLSGVVALPHVYKGQRIAGLDVRAFMQDEYVTETVIPAPDDPSYGKPIQMTVHKTNAQTGLKGVIIPETYHYIGAGAFGYCYNMGTLFVPKSITFVGRGAFYQTTYGGEKRKYSLKSVPTGKPIFPPLLDEDGYPVVKNGNILPDENADPVSTAYDMKLVITRERVEEGGLTIMFEGKSATGLWHPQWQEGMHYTKVTKSGLNYVRFFAPEDEYNKDKTYLERKAGQLENKLVNKKKYKLGFKDDAGDTYMITSTVSKGYITLTKWEDQTTPPPGLTLTARKNGSKWELYYIVPTELWDVECYLSLRLDASTKEPITSFEVVDNDAFYFDEDVGTLHDYLGTTLSMSTYYLGMDSPETGAKFMEGDPRTIIANKGTQVLWGKTFEDYLHPEAAEDNTEALNVSGTDQTVASAESITIPDTYLGKPITGIADNGFAGAVATGATIGSNVKSIGAGAFNGAKLKNITIPLNVDVIKSKAFANCKDIKILCEAQSKPDGWAEDWCDNTAEVIWGYCSNHYFETQIIEPTCELPGMTVHFCPTCGDYYTEDIVEPLGHTWEHTESLAATCETQSCDVYICSTCGAVKGDNFAPALGHEWTEWDRISTPTCTMNGYSERRCRRCRHTDSWILPPLGHLAGDWIVDREPTGSMEGKQHKECVNCGEILEIEFIPKVGAGELDGLRFELINSAQYAVSAASTSLSGDIVIPSRFNGLQVSEIAVEGFSSCHNITSVKLAEGISIIGARAFADCSNLKRVLLPESVKSIHEYAFTGCESLECFVLGAGVELLREFALPNLERAYIYYAATEWDWYSDERNLTIEDGNILVGSKIYFYSPIAPVSSGNYWHYVNGEIVVWDPAGSGACQHNYGGWTITVRPTCTKFGAMERTCSLCGKVEIDGIAPLGHDPSDWIIDVQPTVEAEGSKHKECTRCGEILETVAIPKLEDPYTYLVTESGEFLIDEQGNLLII